MCEKQTKKKVFENHLLFLRKPLANSIKPAPTQAVIHQDFDCVFWKKSLPTNQRQHRQVIIKIGNFLEETFVQQINAKPGITNP